MSLSLENEQNIYESNARFHICKNGFYMDFQTFLMLLTTCLTTVTSILLLTETIGILNNVKILIDGSDERKCRKRNSMNYNNCSIIYPGNMTLLLQT